MSYREINAKDTINLNASVETTIVLEKNTKRNIGNLGISYKSIYDTKSESHRKKTK